MQCDWTRHFLSKPSCKHRKLGRSAALKSERWRPSLGWHVHFKPNENWALDQSHFPFSPTSVVKLLWSLVRSRFCVLIIMEKNLVSQSIYPNLYQKQCYKRICIVNHWKLQLFSFLTQIYLTHTTSRTNITHPSRDNTNRGSFIPHCRDPLSSSLIIPFSDIKMFQSEQPVKILWLFQAGGRGNSPWERHPLKVQWLLSDI